MTKASLALAALLASAAALPASAAVYANSVAEVILGSGVRTGYGYDNGATPKAGNATAEEDALGAPDGFFFSPGIGGLIVLNFPGSFAGSNNISAFEITFTCTGGQTNGCLNFPEAAKVYTGSGWVADGTGFANASNTANFTLQSEVFNNQAQGGALVTTVSGSFSQIVIQDTSGQFLAANPKIAQVNAGFDIDAVAVAPVPLPLSLPLLGAGLGALALLRRRDV